MKITNLRLRRLSGTMEVDGPFFEERLVRPLDIYPDFRSRGPGEQTDDRHFRVSETFLQIETDEGVSGICGSVGNGVAFHVSQLASLLIGKDPLATEYLWDVMFRSSVHGRQGEPMMGISVIDNALWDLKGKWLGQPVYRLLGGPTQKTMPAYASMLGYSVTDFDLVRERAQEMKSRGYKAQKWFFRHGPMSGPEGLKLNVQMVKTVRAALGDEDDIMLDCWQSMDVNWYSPYQNQLGFRLNSTLFDNKEWPSTLLHGQISASRTALFFRIITISMFTFTD